MVQHPDDGRGAANPRQTKTLQSMLVTSTRLCRWLHGVMCLALCGATRPQSHVHALVERDERASSESRTVKPHQIDGTKACWIFSLLAFFPID